MVDTNRKLVMTTHVHYAPDRGGFIRCTEFNDLIVSYHEKENFQKYEMLLNLNPDGSLDYSEAMLLMWKEGQDFEIRG